MRADGECRSCRAPIRWAQHAVTGKRMPLDPEPAEAGNVVVVGWEGEAPAWPLPLVKVGRRAEGEAVTSYRYTSHFATCPNASRHRRRDRGRISAYDVTWIAVGLGVFGVVAWIAAGDEPRQGPTSPAECIAQGGEAWFDRQGDYDGCKITGPRR